MTTLQREATAGYVHGERVKLFHLTLTGYHAGQPLCGVDKEQAAARGEEFAHYMYAPSAWFKPECNLVCPSCKAEVAALDTDAEQF